jgi:hypothetical protein
MLVVSVIWLVQPNSIYAGFVLGTAFSLVNTYILYRNVVFVTEVVAANRQNRMRITGISWRIFFVVLAVLIANKLEDINVFATIFGLFFTQIIAYIYFLINSIVSVKGGRM